MSIFQPERSKENHWLSDKYEIRTTLGSFLLTFNVRRDVSLLISLPLSFRRSCPSAENVPEHEVRTKQTLCGVIADMLGMNAAVPNVAKTTSLSLHFSSGNSFVFVAFLFNSV